MKEKLFLIDAMAVIYRAYFAMIGRPLKDNKGNNVSAIYGFVNSLLKILEEENPNHIAVCFDNEKPTFRHKEFPSYKAQRAEIPDDMPWQINEVKEIVKLFNIPSIELEGYEADDIVGTLIKQAEKEDVQSFMVTPDKDYMQLVSEKTFLYKPSRTATGNKVSDIEIIGIEQVNTKFGVNPDKVIEVLGLMGDTADNIPGVKGVGEKTAIALIQQFGSIENIYLNIDKITKPKLKEILIRDKENAFLAKRLVTIKCDVPLDINFHHLNRCEPNKAELSKRFEELNMKTFARKFGSSSSFIIPKSVTPTEIPVKTIADDETPAITIQGAKVEDLIPEEEKNIQTIRDIKHDYYAVTTKENYIKLIDKLLKEPVISFDTETTSLNIDEAKLVGLSFAFQENQAFYVPVSTTIEKESESLFDEKVNTESAGLNVDFVIEKLRPLLESKKVRKVGQNLKYDYLIMKKYGIEIDTISFDTMIGAFVLNPESMQNNMNDLSIRWLKYRPIPITDLIGKSKPQLTMAEVDLKYISEYACEDADVTLRLYHRIEYELQKLNMIKLCEEIEFPLTKILSEMEWEGIKVDKNILQQLNNDICKYIVEYEKKIYELAGKEFNINSPSQLADLLINDLKIPLSKKTKTGFSTDISVLEELKSFYPIAEALIEYRIMSKLKSTYIDGLSKSISARTGRVHTCFNQIGASTGRLSSTNPNLQNIPIKTDIGRSLRKAFVAKNEDYLILSADYSQIELRIMAHYSKDENFINAFKKKRDIHNETAMRVFNLQSKSEMTQNQRRKAKEVNFGIIYGIGAFGLARRLEIKNTEAKEIIDRYFNEFPQIHDYLEKTKNFARQNGYVETLFGRRRYLPQINNQNATVRGEAERAAINMPIQGTAADMIKIAMIQIFNKFREKKFESKMLLQVHDELVFDVKKSELEEVQKIILREMKNAVKLDVPIEVEVGTGINWFDAH